MANEKNLIPYQFTSDQSREEAAKNGSIGGKASGAARRAKRDAKAVASFVLSLTPELPPAVLDTMQRMGIRKNAKPDMRMIATLAIMQKAMKGDIQCYKFLIEMAGETSEAAILEAKAEEFIRRSAYSANPTQRAPIDSDKVQQCMSEMSDEELTQYEKLCAMFEDESEDGK